jgi:hypothetical protein
VCRSTRSIRCIPEMQGRIGLPMLHTTGSCPCRVAQ